jgi:flagellar assembly protein FliH
MVKTETSLFTKFQFDTSFDEATVPKMQAALAQEMLAAELSWVEEEAAEVLPPPPPTFTEEELELAKKLSFEEGRSTGIADAKDSLEQKQFAILQRIVEQIDSLQNLETTQWQDFQAQTVAVGVAIAKALFPTWVNAAKQLELTAMLQAVLPALQAEARLNVAVAASEAVWLEDMLLKMLQQQGCTATVHLETRDDLQSGDLVLLGEHSSAERIQASVWETIEKMAAVKPVQKKEIIITEEEIL